jgi:SNF2 family DNA or RNA helicase
LLCFHSRTLAELNLQQQTVIFYDVSFNPQVERQAEGGVQLTIVIVCFYIVKTRTDRCHRLGQTKPVMIYRLVAERTIDESILLLANEKKALNDEMLEVRDFESKRTRVGRRRRRRR